MPAQDDSPFELWIDRLRPQASLVRIALGAVLISGLWMAAVFAILSLAGSVLSARGLVVAYLVSFGMLLFGVGLVMRLLHGLPGALLLGPHGRIEPRRFARGTIVVSGAALLLALPAFLVDPPAQQQAVGTWMLWLPAALPAIFVQATAEEVVFRGYLQGMLAARVPSPLVWWVLPAVLFGLLHWSPQLGDNSWLMMAAATLMGLALGDIAVRSGGLSLPIGIHFANNLFAVLFLASPSQLSDLALFLAPFEDQEPEAVRAALVGNMVVVAIAWGLYRLATWRRNS